FVECSGTVAHGNRARPLWNGFSRELLAGVLQERRKSRMALPVELRDFLRSYQKRKQKLAPEAATGTRPAGSCLPTAPASPPPPRAPAPRPASTRPRTSAR